MENICEWENCKELGKYKAPIERDNSKNYKWLCEDHIKQFNKNWNYFEGMSQKEIEIFLKSDITWHRPTQEFGSSDNFFNILWNNALNDGIGNLNSNNEYRKKYRKEINFSEKDKEAFKIIELGVGSKWEKIHSQFKKLVKKYHPDMNAGNKKFEEKLKIITLAYTQLKLTYKGK